MMTRPVIGRGMINYDPDTGFFTWAPSLDNQLAGKQAGTIVTKGYRHIVIDGKRYIAHRLAWYWMTGEWPERQIDHINGNPDDNRFCNLRLASNSENKCNSAARADSRSGIKYVSWRPSIKKWTVYAGMPQKRVGNFTNLTDAILCANAHIGYLHGPFARLNPLQGEYSHD